MKLVEKKIEENNVILTIKMSEYAFTQKFVICQECGGLIFRDETIEIDGRFYCENCVNTCCCCGAVMPISETYSVEDSSEYYCHDCYDTETYICDGCHNHYRYEDSLIYSEADDCDYCAECYDKSDSNIIKSYHTFKDSGNLMFLGEEPRTATPYIGFELEIDSNYGVDRDGVAEEIMDIMPEDYFHFENDGSLSSNGFENISQPCSLSYNLALREKFAELFSCLIESDMRSHDIGTCGYHIHIDRRYFGKKEDSSIAKLLYLFEKFSPELLKFSRRTYGQVNDWARSYKDDDEQKKWITNAIKKKGYYNRYHAVNLCNSNTIEIRLWRGTLNLETFFATMKFTVRLAEIAKNTSAVEIAKLTWNDLLGEDAEILSYWNRIKDRQVEQNDEEDDF